MGMNVHPPRAPQTHLGSLTMGNGPIAELCPGCDTAVGNSPGSEGNGPAVVRIAARADSGSVTPKPAKGREEQM